MKCSVIDCSSPVHARGWCLKHYLRWWKYGDVSIVKHPREYVPRGRESVNFKHGCWNHDLYKVWNNMISRCDNPSDRSFVHYGGRGISVCKEWYDINRFIEDMGPRPKRFTLNRIDNDGNYEPSNCEWTTVKENTRNRRSVILNMDKARQIREMRNEGIMRAHIAEEFGVSVATVKKVISGEYWLEDR